MVRQQRRHRHPVGHADLAAGGQRPGDRDGVHPRRALTLVTTGDGGVLARPLVLIPEAGGQLIAGEVATAQLALAVAQVNLPACTDLG